jgi:hypothetical protein
MRFGAPWRRCWRTRPRSKRMAAGSCRNGSRSAGEAVEGKQHGSEETALQKRDSLATLKGELDFIDGMRNALDSFSDPSVFLTETRTGDWP